MSYIETSDSHSQSSTTTNNKRKLLPLLPNNVKKSKLDSNIDIINTDTDTDTDNNNILTIPPIANVANNDTRFAKIINPSNICLNCSPDQPKPRHLKSCSRCRKHKTKCNFMETAPYACTSCAKKGVICELEIVIPIKRSNIIKNLSNDIQNLKNLVDDLIIKDNYLKSLCQKKGIKVDGLVNIDICKRNLDVDDLISDNENEIENENENENEDEIEIENDNDNVYDYEHEYEHNENLIVERNEKNRTININKNKTKNNNKNKDINKDINKIKNGNKYNANTNMNIKDNADIYNSINNILSKFENVITPPHSNTISPNLSDNEHYHENDHDSIHQKGCCAHHDIYTLNDCCYLSYPEISQIFSEFNKNYLPFVPILDPIDSFDDLFNSNKLLFWSIVYIISKNTDIYTKYIIKEVLNFTKEELPSSTLSPSTFPDPYDSIVPIILLSCFPTKMNSTKYDIDDELDTCIFQWLQICKSKCSNFNYIQKYIDDHENNNYKKNIWCVLFILGNFYGFRLGLKWVQPLDFILEESMDKTSYLGQLLNATILLSKLLDHFVFTSSGSQSEISNIHNDYLLIKSLSNWKFKLERLRSNLKMQDALLKSNLLISLDFLELVFNLFDPQLNLDKSYQIINNFNTNLNNIPSSSILKCPIFLKISLEFVSLILTKISYSPHILKNMKNADLYINLFNKLIPFVEFNDTRLVFNTLMDFDSSIKLDSSLLNIFQMSSFKEKLMPGLIKDLQKLNSKFKSITLNSNRLSKIENSFKSFNLDFNSYKKSFTSFRNHVDLVIIYSNEILELCNSDNELRNGSLSTSSIISNDDAQSIITATTATTTTTTTTIDELLDSSVIMTLPNQDSKPQVDDLDLFDPVTFLS